MKNLIRSFSINLVISSLAGLINALFGGSFLYVFLLSILVQYVLYSVITTIIVNFYREKTKQIELNKLENLSTILECAYCSQKNLLTFIPEQNERTEFICSSCDKENAVIINFTVARVTEAIPINSLLKDEDKK
jgi:transcription elongation factor Elf1